MVFKLGRKFWACLLAEILLTGIFLFVLYKTPWAVQFETYAVYGVLSVTVCFAYIGGNVWSKWTTSKYFRNELVDK